MCKDAHAGIEQYTQTDITEDAFEGIVDGIVLLSYEIAQKHGYTIAGNSRPGAGHVAVAGDKEEVASHQNDTTGSGKPRSPDGAVGEFVPEREVEVDAFDDFSHHHHSHGGKSFPIVATHQIFQHIDIGHDEEKGCEGEDDEVFHRGSIGGAIVARTVVFGCCKDEGFIGIAEGLCDERHDHGYLDSRSIDA